MNRTETKATLLIGAALALSLCAMFWTPKGRVPAVENGLRVAIWNMEWFPAGGPEPQNAAVEGEKILAAGRVLRRAGVPDVFVVVEIRDEETCQALAGTLRDPAFQPVVCSDFLYDPTNRALQQIAIFSRYPNVPQDLVELEITETAGSFENNTFMELIQKFGEYGLKFSLDDFGSNYSNMSMLAELPFHSVKLDRSMVRSMTENSVSKMMVRDIAKICESCNMLCIAEGVETQAQVDSLIENGCFYAQGYFYGKPMPIDEFERKYFQTTV